MAGPPEPSTAGWVEPITHGAAVAFEIAWRGDTRPDIRAFLPPPGPTRLHTLLELVLLDAAHCRRAGLPVRADDYLGRFPELAADPRAVEELRRADAAAQTLPARAGDPAAVAPPGYEILGELGRGGMGVVYKARQVRLNRTVALKMVLRQGDEKALSRFLAEAEAAAAIDHPHVVRVYESGHHAGQPYLAMEHLDGGTLAERLKARGRVEPRPAAGLLGQIARGVAAAHGLGIVHRDLKPGNVLFDAAGVAKVGDFGLAKRGTGSDLTATQAVMGTPAYMAPEQAGGGAKFVGPQADVWALGVVLYEGLTGARPFPAADAMEVLRRVREDTPDPPRRLVPGVPRDLELVCLKCLEKDPADRYPTAAELAEDLDRFAAGQPVSVRPAGPLERLTKWGRRNPTVAGLTAAVAALLVAVTAASVVIAVRERTAAGRIAAEQENTRAALDQSRRLSAQLALTRGLALCDQGDVGGGTVWLAQALRLADRAGAADLGAVARANLALWGQRSPRLTMVLPTGDRGPVEAAALSPDGTRIATAFADRTVVLWAATGEAVGGPFRSAAPVEHLVFSPDGRVLAVRSRDVVELRDVATGARTGDPLRHHDQPIWAVAFSPDSALVVTAGEDRVARVWDAATGRASGPTLTHEGPVHAAAFSPDGRQILTAAWDKERAARLWDAATGKEDGKPWPHRDLVEAVAFAPGGRTAATAAWDGSVQVWNPGTGTTTGQPLAHTRPVMAVTFGPDGRTLLTRDQAGVVQLWAATTGRPVATLRPPGPVTAAAWSPDGRAVLTGGSDGVRLWEADGEGPGDSTLLTRGPARGVGFARDGRTVMTADRVAGVRLWVVPDPTGPGRSLAHGGPDARVAAAAFSPDGRLVLTGGRDHTARLWDGESANPIGEPLGHQGPVVAAAFGPDGRLAVTGSVDRTARLWDVGTGKQVGRDLTHPAPVVGVAVSPDGTRVATRSSDGTARLWDPATQRPVGEPFGHGRQVEVATFSPDGRVLLTAGQDGSARLWDAATGRPLGEPRPHDRPVTAAGFTPDGMGILTLGQDGSARVWDAEGRPHGSPLRPAEPIRALAFSPDGRLVAAASDDQTARLWDPAAGTALGAPIAHANRVVRVALAPDGRVLATATVTGSVRLWDAGTGLPLGPPLPHRGGVWAMSFGPDGRTLLTAGGEGPARVWRVRPAEGDAEHVSRSAGVTTGLELDDDQGVRVLDAATWREYRRRLEGR